MVGDCGSHTDSPNSSGVLVIVVVILIVQLKIWLGIVVWDLGGVSPKIIILRKKQKITSSTPETDDNMVVDIV